MPLAQQIEVTNCTWTFITHRGDGERNEIESNHSWETPSTSFVILISRVQWNPNSSSQKRCTRTKWIILKRLCWFRGRRKSTRLYESGAIDKIVSCRFGCLVCGWIMRQRANARHVGDSYTQSTVSNRFEIANGDTSQQRFSSRRDGIAFCISKFMISSHLA